MAPVGICPICGKEKTLQLHHIIPRALSPIELVKDKRNHIYICPSCHLGYLRYHPQTEEEWKERRLADLLVWINQAKRYGPGWLTWYIRMAAATDDREPPWRACPAFRPYEFEYHLEQDEEMFRLLIFEEVTRQELAAL